MKPIKLPSGLTRAFHKVGFECKKHSPEILVGAGIVGVVGTVVLACRATLKAKDVLADTKRDLDNIHTCVESYKEEYTVEDAKKDTTIVYTQTALKFVKLYAPAVGLGALSLACIIKSHDILNKRNAALAAAYATVDTSFKDYRKRVIERLGEEMDKELRYNIKAKEVEETTIDENGEEKTVRKTVQVMDPNLYSDYARVYDDGCIGWTKDPEYNYMFLKTQQNYANDLLKEQGWLFLNDVYKMLGIPQTKAGMVVGWVYDEKNPVGDNFVDFGLYNIDNERVRAFINGHERNIILDFNVDGVVYDLMK